MITELLIIAAAGVINPMDMSDFEMYPSGVKECDKYPRFAPPASKLATLTLPHPILANDGRIIPSGHYLAALSVSKNEILVFEGRTELFTLSIDGTEILEKPRKISTATFYTDDNSESFIILTEGKLRVVGKVNLYRETP